MIKRGNERREAGHNSRRSPQSEVLLTHRHGRVQRAARIVQNDTDITVILAYYPPSAAGTSRAKQRIQEKTVTQLNKWVQSVIDQLPIRTTVVMMSDPNDSFVQCARRPDLVGQHCQQRQGKTADQMLALMQRNDLIAANILFSYWADFL